MLDINFIRENKKVIAEAIKNKNVELDLDKLLQLDEQRRELQHKVDQIRTKRNVIAEDLKDATKRTPEIVAEGKKLKDELSGLEEESRQVGLLFTDLMYLVPNIISEDTPIGRDDSQNEVVEVVGKPTKFDFEPKDHIALGESLDILDLERGVKTGGFRGYYLKNEGAQMHLAILQYTLNKLIAKGFTPMITPTIVREEAMYAMGQFPLYKDNTFKLANSVEVEDDKRENRYLAGTSEVALVNYYSDEVLEKQKLPIKLCGFSQCFRSEVGSYGKDTKGIYRIHEFAKVEQVIIAENDLNGSLKLLEELRQISEEILSDLKLPYRVLAICTGDMGLGKYKMYDLEAWMPVRGKYGETHSDSFLTDWQARRANIRYRDGEDVKFVHTLNNTAIASPRVLIAIWENYQQADGSIKVPEVLIPYMGGVREIRAK
jgi:seryl-tRNA synthetase